MGNGCPCYDALALPVICSPSPGSPAGLCRPYPSPLFPTCSPWPLAACSAARSPRGRPRSVFAATAAILLEPWRPFFRATWALCVANSQVSPKNWPAGHVATLLSPYIKEDSPVFQLSLYLLCLSHMLHM
ncbi:Hypothetical predicted protein [Pelobates cultripes]|uniref:Uncharacterized protein n=1 Tax=Pelobates cultripes TaxID=61616 RepID=A0AAD1RMB5_PELCU|nr:Hypothetical predicted protein [Pelobates cultripes]